MQNRPRQSGHDHGQDQPDDRFSLAWGGQVTALRNWCEGIHDLHHAVQRYDHHVDQHENRKHDAPHAGPLVTIGYVSSHHDPAERSHQKDGQYRVFYRQIRLQDARRVPEKSTRL